MSVCKRSPCTSAESKFEAASDRLWEEVAANSWVHKLVRKGFTLYSMLSDLMSQWKFKHYFIHFVCMSLIV